ncbi:hypothetical protein D5S17_15340 [Pseudonocardiaceae bacterium YIM PH 21723]|nr:hypothetical protein D5S17_15340 [Pseudonocardiaceae bacterium YIM PH 21723]
MALMGTEIVLFLIVGVVIAVVSGQMFSYNGRKYVGGKRGGAGAALASIPFHLATLGVVVLISVYPFEGEPIRNFLLRLGLLLLLLAVLYGIAVGVFHRRHQEQEVAEFERKHGMGQVPTGPVPDQDDRVPEPRTYEVGNDQPGSTPEKIHPVDPRK